jgi:hypothetical protein
MCGPAVVPRSPFQTMKYLAAVVLSLMIATTTTAQLPWLKVGNTYALDKFDTCDDPVGWWLNDVDEGVKVSIEKNGMILSVLKHQGLIAMTAGCGHDPRTGTFDTRTSVLLFGGLPLMITTGTEVHFECPPNGFAHITLASRQ